MVGLTATPFTSAGKKLDYWNDPVWYKSLKDFMDEGQLVKIKATLLEPKSFDYTMFEEVKFTEYNIDELYSEESTAQEVVNAVLQLYNQQKSAVYRRQQGFGSVGQVGCLAVCFCRARITWHDGLFSTPESRLLGSSDFARLYKVPKCD